MGLIERRLIKEAKEAWLPGELQEIESIAGAAVAVDIDWASFESDEAALKNLQHLGVRKLVNALRVICRDDLGKEAVRDSIKRMVVVNQPAITEPTVGLEGGTVTLVCHFGKGPDGCLTDLQIARVLERAL
jgi:hypothetical protein